MEILLIKVMFDFQKFHRSVCEAVIFIRFSAEKLNMSTSHTRLNVRQIKSNENLLMMFPCEMYRIILSSNAKPLWNGQCISRTA